MANAQLLEEVKTFDYVRFTFSDMHGIARCNTIPQRHVKLFLEKGMSLYIGAVPMGVRNQAVVVPEATESCFGNAKVMPRPGTAHSLPWAGRGKHKIGEVLCNWYLNNGDPMEGDSVNACRKQMDRLENKGFRLFSAFEMEYTLFDAETNEPAFDKNDMHSALIFSELEDYFFTLETNLIKAGVDTEGMQTEFGPGQIEFMMNPQWDIKTADDTFIFREAAKEVATQVGKKAVFMSKPSEKCLNSGCHFNFSIWDKAGNNLFQGEDGRLSDFGRHFIAGLCKHGAALTAVCSPTVNCYRRYTYPFSPKLINWGYDNRLTAFSVKLQGHKGPRIENRLVGSAFNPYLVLAGHIQAGLDGVEKKLEPPPSSTKDSQHGDPLPKTLGEALDALEADKEFVESMGPMLIRWFTQCKQDTEISAVPRFDPEKPDQESMAAEWDLYSHCL